MKKRYPIKAEVICSSCGAVLPVVFNNYFDKARRQYYCNEPACKEVEKQHRGKRQVRDSKARDYSTEVAARYEPPKPAPAPLLIPVEGESEYHAALRRYYQLAGRVSPASPRTVLDRW